MSSASSLGSLPDKLTDFHTSNSKFEVKVILFYIKCVLTVIIILQIRCEKLEVEIRQ